MLTPLRSLKKIQLLDCSKLIAQKIKVFSIYVNRYMYIKTLSNLYIFSISLNQCLNFSVFLFLQNFQGWLIRILLAENFSPITLQINFIAITCLITLLHKNINIKWHNYKLITSYCYIHKDITAFFEHNVYWFTSDIKPPKWGFSDVL